MGWLNLIGKAKKKHAKGENEIEKWVIGDRSDERGN